MKRNSLKETLEYIKAIFILIIGLVLWFVYFILAAIAVALPAAIFVVVIVWAVKFALNMF